MVSYVKFCTNDTLGIISENKLKMKFLLAFHGWCVILMLLSPELFAKYFTCYLLRMVTRQIESVFS